MRYYKILLDKQLKDNESIKRLMSSTEHLLGEDSRVIVLEDGADIKPLHSEWYGLINRTTKQWKRNQGGSIVYYPSIEIATADASNYEVNKDKYEVASFNGFDELFINENE